MSRATRAKRLGKKVPKALLSMDGVQSVPAMAVQVETMLKPAETHLAALPGGSLKPLLANGKKILDGIKAVDTEQEVKRLKSLPEAVRRFYYEKGLLLTGTKVINDAGRELYAEDPAASSTYNLSILYRNTGKRKTAIQAKA